MPFQETVTIINNSGKIISTGKHLVSIFKEARAAYKDKKDAVKAERAAGLHRAKTFDVNSRAGPALQQHYYEFEDSPYVQYPGRHQIEGNQSDLYDDGGRRRFQDDVRSSTSSRRSHRSRRSQQRGSDHRPPLTESNLRTLSEVSSTTPSTMPLAYSPTNYRSPYAETMPRDMTVSRLTLAHSPTIPVTPTLYHAPTQVPNPAIPGSAPSVTETASPTSTPRESMLVNRTRSDPSLRHREKQIDLNLAYGSIPPDLASRTDLDAPAPTASSVPPEQREAQARTLLQRIDTLLTEAECLHHTATHIISHLQSNPEAAAAVALTLAELSHLLTKMSPAFLGVVKGGFPAVFALLASPQFLVGVGVAVGVTVVMFGGWKIVKRIREARKEKEEAVAFEMAAIPNEQSGRGGGGVGAAGYHHGAAFAGGAGGFDEALVLEEELSTIESWRRGIVPFGEDESADMELISPEAERAVRARHREETDVAGGADARTERSARTHRTSKSTKTHRNKRSHRRRQTGEGDEDNIPERKSTRSFKERERVSDRGSDAGTRDDNRDDDERSDRSHRSHRSSRSKGTARIGLRVIEDASQDHDNTLEAALRPKEKEKKGNMLKQLFRKKKEKEDREKEKGETAVSVLV